MRSLHTPRGWAVFAALAATLLAGVPLLNALPADSALHLPDYLIPLIGKFCCYALVALAMDLIWGYTGILSLGHGAFFALGGYAMGMHLMRAMAGEGVYRSELPDFMVFLNWKELPWFWHGFEHFGFALLMALLLPALLAFVFGWFAFRSRIKGVYFSIITQALTFALMLLFFRNETGFGGNNGLTDFKRLLGFALADPAVKLGLYLLSAATLLGVYLLARAIVRSKFGRVLTAIRDAESRTMFCGYEPLYYKLAVWTLSAVLCGLAGALYVPQVGIINPSEMAPTQSIEMAVWVAVGGRGTLIGAITGAAVVNGLKSWFTAAAPDLWLYALGGLFIGVTLFLPEGLTGLAARLRRRPAPLAEARP
ncbi:amino acid/amide ABC transporter membrane protein 2 (HAAT family) [Plasticicumulans lactativorans]|uniref:Amino acid/amide ABC transporter membrane protein 2 (HAAT family) n=1 Tax=Plasticicumulans lactativorans TaxID=1133106 RepID=A0A4R2LAM9_9GAMM|nr:urea ABC transporter permease subunit UrtC [Plasticicumulans lactativorans]TCO76325.1 amino acid/amide ABC transporter membrane protein 2 (HAAT family) [Plasticicumulans lactativorans]